MTERRFTWDPHKEQGNRRKHRVSFVEAVTVFSDPRAVTFPDLEHDIDEDRWIILGTSDRMRTLLVVHVERGETIRIISARKASASERESYEKGDRFH